MLGNYVTLSLRLYSSGSFVVQICKGMCLTYKTESMPDTQRYKSGQKRCNRCEYFFRIDEIFCPCCKTRLRTKTRSKKIWNQM
jgi:uncharacterized paraquat-inducible protein A